MHYCAFHGRKEQRQLLGVAEFVNIVHIVTEAKQKYTSAKARLDAAEEAGEEKEKTAALEGLQSCTQDVLGIRL